MSGGKEMSKESKSFQDKLKQFFRKGGIGTLKTRIEITIPDNMLHDLSPESPFSIRTKAIKELCDIVLSHRLEDKSVEKLWNLVQDLLAKEQPLEVRHLAFSFLQCLVKGQYERLGIMRSHFFRVIKFHDHPEDVVCRFELLQTLTDNGKDILYFEEEFGLFLLNWSEDISKVGKMQEYLLMLVTAIKFNAAYMDENVISGLVVYGQMGTVCYTTLVPAIVLDCLQVLDTMVAYSFLPKDMLVNFILTLCRVINGETYCSMGWRVMRNLLGTHLGHAAIFKMCAILQAETLHDDNGLMRGAVFFLYMALWGNQALPNLRCPISSVLPSILAATETKNKATTYEVMFAIQQLVNKLALELHDLEWDIVIRILLVIVRQLAVEPNVTPNQLTARNLHDTLTTIENLIEVGTFYGPIHKFYDVIEECSSARPETSIFKLIAYLARDIVPIRHMWFSNLYNLLSKYYRQDNRTNIRLRVLGVLSKVMKLNRPEYEDELIDRIVVPHLVHIVNDPDAVVRTAVAELLVELCMECESNKCLELLDILERLITCPFENFSHDVPANELDISDVKSAVFGLINVFVYNIHHLPSSHAVRIYKMLVLHLEQHYVKPKIFEDSNQIRYKILDCFLKMRADPLYHIGYPESNAKYRFSPYLCVTYRTIERGPLGSPPPISPAVNQQPACVITYVPLRRVFKIFITCLRQEKDWEVLQLVLHGIPHVLQNKSLILSKQGNNEVDLLVDTLSALITDRNLCLPESLRGVTKPNRTDFHACVLMVIANLASYHIYLDQVHQQRMIRCLVKYGLVPRCSRQCIMALTICTLEMKDVMVKMFPEVLLDLSKVSATVHIATAILEFLSTLTKIPTVFASFVGDQYMAVFAIALPYTNPFKYNHYVVSLAHHVIAVWFLKCRLPFRREFIAYITTGLQTNVLIPFEEKILRTNLSNLNEDSSNRKRSSSLTEQSSRRRERSSTMATRTDSKPEFKPMVDRAVLTFYEELTETCIDFMARYTFSSCNALPRRSATTDYLLHNGHSMTWFYGNKLITITTSGCSQKAIKHGLCDKCWQTCRLDRSDSEQNVPQASGSSEKDKEDSNSNLASRQNSTEKCNTNTSASSPIEENKKLNDKLEQLPIKLQQLMMTDGNKPLEKQVCTCWCQSWAEIYIRRATGDISWIMRIQNQLAQHLSMDHYPFTEVSNVCMPIVPQHPSMTSANRLEQTTNASSTSSMPISIPGSPCKQSPSRQSSRDSIEEDLDENLYEDEGKSRNPVRRSNSSPEMSSNWKNPFLQKQEREDSRIQDEEGAKKTKTFTKDMRVSCEAIPEEIAGTGTTPPSNEPIQSTSKSLGLAQQQPHPALLSCHSYPGSASPTEQTIALKSSHTVPQSPNVVVQATPPLSLPLGQARASGILKFSKTDSIDSIGSEKVPERPSTLSSLSNLPPLSSKPPQSPTQTSPRLPRHVQTKEGHEIQKSSSLNLERTHSLKMKDRKNDNERQSQPELSQKRDRGYTISVMSTTRKPRLENLRQSISSRPKDVPRSGISPSFVFLQMYYSAQFGSTNETPVLVGSSQVVQRAVKVLDCIPPYETHRIGVLYVGEGQANNETEILRNRLGSVRYITFLSNLGTLIKLQDVDPQMVYLGGLEQDGNDGNFTYIWQDDIIRVTFHIATLMPYKEHEPTCNNKKLHIGNNNVTIVYNESGEDYNINTIRSEKPMGFNPETPIAFESVLSTISCVSIHERLRFEFEFEPIHNIFIGFLSAFSLGTSMGQFNFACIVVQPLDQNTCKVIVKAKDELIELMGNSDPKIVSDQNVALLARQLALHADLASLVSRSLKSQSQDPYASNWLERLRKIKNVRAKMLQEKENRKESGEPEDTTATTKPVKWMEDFSAFM